MLKISFHVKTQREKKNNNNNNNAWDTGPGLGQDPGLTLAPQFL